MATAKAGRRQNRWGQGSLLREEIVAAARELLEEQGVESAVSFSAVARRVGITGPAIYPHFADHNALIRAVIAEVYSELDAALMASVESLPEQAGPRDRLQAFSRSFVDFGADNPASFAVLYARHRPSAVPEVRQVALANVQLGLQIMAQALPHLPAEAVSRRGTLLWCALYGVAVLPVHNPHYPWGQRDQLIDELIALHLA